MSTGLALIANNLTLVEKVHLPQTPQLYTPTENSTSNFATCILDKTDTTYTSTKVFTNEPEIIKYPGSKGNFIENPDLESFFGLPKGSNLYFENLAEASPIESFAISNPTNDPDNIGANFYLQWSPENNKKMREYLHSKGLLLGGKIRTKKSGEIVFRTTTKGAVHIVLHNILKEHLSLETFQKIKELTTHTTTNISRIFEIIGKSSIAFIAYGMLISAVNQ